MNREMIKQIHKDYEEILSSESGKRVLGGIFYVSGVCSVVRMNVYQQGRRSVATQIANTIREVNPYGVADCITAYEEFMKRYAEDDNGRNDYDSDNDDYRAEYTD